MLTNHTQRSLFRSKTGYKAVILAGAVLGASTLSGCDNAGEGLFTGAALGAVTGLVIGSMNGDAGEGAALGAIIGGAGGAILGDQNQRNRENARYGTYETRRGPAYRSNHPYCSTHSTYHSHRSHPRTHHGSNGRGYGYDDWWND